MNEPEGKDDANADAGAAEVTYEIVDRVAHVTINRPEARNAINSAVAKGIAYLLATQGPEGFWEEPRYTATGFPRVFYLRYHGYAKFFPLWALARYRNLTTAGSAPPCWGM